MIDGQDWGGHSRVNVKNAKALRVVLMGPATIALVVAQLAVATAFELSWLADDGRLGAWRTEHEISWMWLLAAQLLAVGSGVWEGRGATIDVRRITVYASVPVLLVVWYMTQAAYATHTDVSMILQLIPSIGGTMILFSPSWVAIAVGVYIQRGLSSGMSAP